MVEETGIYSPVGIVEEFDRAIREELDFVHEAENVRAFQETHRERRRHPHPQGPRRAEQRRPC